MCSLVKLFQFRITKTYSAWGQIEFVILAVITSHSRWCQTVLNDRLVLTCTLWLLLNTQRLFFTASGWFNPPSASHPPPMPTPPPIELIHDIGGVQKKVSQNPAVLAK